MSTSGPPEAVREELPEPFPSGTEFADTQARWASAVEAPSLDPQATPATGPASGEPPQSAAPAHGAPAAEEGALPPRRWGFGAYLLAEAVFLGSSVLLVLPYAGPGKGSPPPIMLLLSLLIPTVLAAGVALLATRLRGNGPRIDLGLRFTLSDLRQGLVLGCAGLVLTMPAAQLWSWAVGPSQANSAVGEMFANQRFSPPLAVGVFLVVWLIAPVCEEIVYRGLLWGAMERHGAGRWWAFGLTTLCFALAHFEFSRTPLLLLIAVPIGLARLYTGRLGASIIAHQMNNLLPALSVFLVLLGVIQP